MKRWKFPTNVLSSQDESQLFVTPENKPRSAKATKNESMACPMLTSIRKANIRRNMKTKKESKRDLHCS